MSVDRIQLDAVVAALIAQAMPLVEGDSATFAIRADADAVYLRHRSNQWPRNVPLAKIPGTDLWFVTMPIEPRARVQYQFELVTGESGRRLDDPNNPLLSRSPVGDCSVCFGSGYVEPAWAGVRTDTAPGQLVELQLHSHAQDRDNRVTIYLPAAFNLTARYPLLVVHDGGDYLGYAAMKAVLDNLIAAGEVAPLVAAFIYPGGQRLIEYADDPRHAAWVARELVPELETRYPLVARASGRCLMGASFGAVASLATAVRYPQAFSSLLLQSGSFVYSNPAVNHGEGRSFVPVIAFVDSYRADPVRVADRCFISCGAYEDLIDANRGMLPVFQQTGMAINYVETLAGHSWDAWRDQLRDALGWIFPTNRS